MKVIKQQEANVDELVQELKQGKVIVYPTETCYGLGCDATNAEAVDGLFEIKKRQKDKAVLVLVSDLAMAGRYIELTPKILDLAKKYWPGALTLVVPILDKKDLSDGVVGADNTIAIRVTDHYFAHELCEKLDLPLVSTSANIAAQESPYDVDSVLKMYENADEKPDIVIDGGVLPHKNPSTIVRVDGDNLEVLRQGDIVL